MISTLRATEPADIPTLHRLMRDFARYEKLEHRFKITEAGLHEVLFGPKPMMDSTLAEVDGTTVGFALWFLTFGTFSGRYGLFVEDIYVEEAHRGSGIGLALFRHMARIAVERDCIEMAWNVLDWNTPAIEFYRRIGARPVQGWIPQQLSGDALVALAEGAGMADQTFDLVVVGGGPGGYVAAIRAAQLGMKTAVVEREHLGGICLNWGCIPTKALLRTSEINHLLHHLPDYGFSPVESRFEIDKVVKRSRAVAKQLSQGVAHLLRKNKVTVFDGAGKLAGKQTLAVEKAGAPVATLKSPHIILATGARARQLPGIESDGKLIWAYKEAMVPPAMPKSLLVIGSGAIGIEFASFYRNMGAEVTVVEVLPRILPVEDEEISAFAHKAFEKQGIRILVGATVKGAKKGKDNVTVTVEAGGKGHDITVDRLISAVGIVGNVEGIGLEGTGVKVDRTHVVIDEYCRTGEPGVYAIGDMAGPPWLAHKASHEGVVCVEKIAGLNDVHPLDATNIPGCTYCRPQVASVGLTEARAKEAGHEVKVGKFPFIGNGKAIAMGEPEGMVKTVFDAKTGELLGAHMVGAEVTEMIQGFAIARTLESTEAELMATVFPHPTVSETMHESVLDAWGRVIHI